VEDGERAIEALVNLDGGLGVGVAAVLCLGQELDEVGGEGDRVVVTDDALVLEAEDGLWIELGRPRATCVGAGVPASCSGRVSGRLAVRWKMLW